MVFLIRCCNLALTMANSDLYEFGQDWMQSEISGLNCILTDEGFISFTYSYKKMGQNFVITPPLAPHAFQLRSGQKAPVLEDIVDYINKNLANGYIQLALKVDPKYRSRLSDYGFEVREKPNFVLDISRNISDLKKELSSTRRRHINKSERELDIHFNRDRKKSFKLFRKTYLKGGLSVPEVFFEKLEKQETGHKQILSEVYLDKNLLASNLCIVSGGVAYYLLGGVNTEIKNPHAGSYSLWNCILKAQELGAVSFNFCGSSVPGIAKFFKSFGAQQQTLLEVKKGHKKIDFIKKIKSSLSQ